MTLNRTRRAGALRAPRASAGVSMIEVLVSIVILAFGLLGIASMQMLALKNTQVSLERSQATVQTYAILDAMRANLAVASIRGYDLGKWTCKVPDKGASLASKDLHDWMSALKLNVSQSACAHISCDGETCLIAIEWDDSKGKLARTTIETSTRL